jgi:prepilin peptidase CpaA
MNLFLLLWLLIAIVQDGVERRVRNSLVLAGMGLALCALALDLQPFALSGAQVLLGGALAFGGLLGFYAFGVMGAADVKFAGALGLWVGPHALLPIWIAASLLAAAHALLWLALQRWPWSPRLALALSGRPGGNGVRTRPIPLAAYLAASAIAYMAWHTAG